MRAPAEAAAVAKGTGMAHGDITHVDIPVSDMGRATAFYEAMFGWKIAEVPGFEGYPMWQALNKVSGGGLAPRSEEFTQPRSYVEVDSIDAALARVSELGGSVAQPKEAIDATSWWAVVVDPDGNVVGLFEGSTGGTA